MSLDSPDGVRWMDDFFGDLVADEWGVSTDTGAGTIIASTGHVLRLNNSNAMNNDMAEIGGELQWRVQDCGTLVMRARCRVNTAVTTVAFNVGLNDDQLEDSNTLPVELSTATFTTNSSSWVGVLFDTNATTDYFYAGAVDDDNDNAAMVANSTTGSGFGFAPVADKWFTVEIRLADQGSGNMARAEVTVIQDIDGLTTNRKTITIANAVDRDVYLCPHIGIENRTTSARVMDIDYVLIEAGRGD